MHFWWAGVIAWRRCKSVTWLVVFFGLGCRFARGSLREKILLVLSHVLLSMLILKRRISRRQSHSLRRRLRQLLRCPPRRLTPRRRLPVRTLHTAWVELKRQLLFLPWWVDRLVLCLVCVSLVAGGWVGAWAGRKGWGHGVCLSPKDVWLVGGYGAVTFLAERLGAGGVAWRGHHSCLLCLIIWVLNVCTLC